MSTRYVIRPAVAVKCDECGAEHRGFPRPGENDYSARQLAARSGWQVKPNHGKGSRNGKDLCPDHRTDAP